MHTSEKKDLHTHTNIYQKKFPIEFFFSLYIFLTEEKKLKLNDFRGHNYHHHHNQEMISLKPEKFIILLAVLLVVVVVVEATMIMVNMCVQIINYKLLSVPMDI